MDNDVPTLLSLQAIILDVSKKLDDHEKTIKELRGQIEEKDKQLEEKDALIKKLTDKKNAKKLQVSTLNVYFTVRAQLLTIRS